MSLAEEGFHHFGVVGDVARLAKSWPPYLQDLDVYWLRAAETVAIATVATAVATVLAFPLSIFIAHNVSPSPMLAMPVRWLVNSFRGVDTIVFALLFVAAVGLEPFAGVLGMIVHSLGVVAKLNSEAIETIPKAPLEAAAMTGANRAKIVSYALLPSVLPNLQSLSMSGRRTSARPPSLASSGQAASA